jgi:hypothetical protein
MVLKWKGFNLSVHFYMILPATLKKENRELLTLVGEMTLRLSEAQKKS